MRTIKPQALTVLHAPFQHNGRIRLVLVVGAMVSLDGGMIEPEQGLWQLVMSAPGSRGFIDEIKPKVRGEALVSGYAFAQEGKPTPIVAARFEVGPLAKEVWAIGDRFWRMTGPTDAVPFDKMPLTYDRAFGGEGFPANPTGKGFAPIKTEAGSVHPLPNIEIPKKLIQSTGDRPPVAGFSSLDPALPQRMKKLGTYDAKWLKTRYPEMADDFDPTYFNMAPEDQWIAGYWQGGEPFVLQNLHPERPKIEGVVPLLRARALVKRVGTAHDVLEDVALRCDTLWFLPHEERLLMLFRGGVDAVDEEASDISEVVVGLERIGAPKPVERYAEIRRLRLDKNKGVLYALRDVDLLPEDLPIGKSQAGAHMDALIQRDGLMEANIRRRAAGELAGARGRLTALGVDPDKHLPRELPPEPKVPASQDLPQYIDKMRAEADAARQDAEKRREAALAQLKTAMARVGVDPQKALAGQQAGGPPKFTAEGKLAELRRQSDATRTAGLPLPALASRLDDPELFTKLQAAEAAMREVYRRNAHFQPPARLLGDAESGALRKQVEAALSAKESLADRDLTGADLSGLDFSGADLHGSFLEKAKLAGCAFRGANVSGAVFTRADLGGADFDGATAVRANFGEADLGGAKFRGADLTEAVLMSATLREADFTGAKLDRAKLSDVKLDRTVLAGVHAENLVLIKVDLRGANLRGARIAVSSFSNVNLSGADLTQAYFFRTSFLDITMEDACLRGVKLERVAFSKVEKGCSLARSDLRGSDLRRINFRGVDLTEADLREADLRDADFSKANLRGAKLEAARATHSRWIGADLTDANLARTDLMGARMGRAVVRGANFEEANLFRADADRMKGDDKTSFNGANLKQVRVTPATTTKPRSPEPPPERPR